MNPNQNSKDGHDDRLELTLTLSTHHTKDEFQMRIAIEHDIAITDEQANAIASDMAHELMRRIDAALEANDKTASETPLPRLNRLPS